MTNITARVHEADLYIPTLRYLDSAPGGFATTSEIIEHLEGIFNISGGDAEILEGRNDTKFSQIVRNMISHRDSDTNFVKKGYVKYDADRNGLQITVTGRKLLQTIIP